MVELRIASSVATVKKKGTEMDSSILVLDRCHFAPNYELLDISRQQTKPNYSTYLNNEAN